MWNSAIIFWIIPFAVYKNIYRRIKKLDPSYLTKLNSELTLKKAKLTTAKRERVKEETKKEIKDIQYEIDSFNKKHAELIKI